MNQVQHKILTMIARIFQNMCDKMSCCSDNNVVIDTARRSACEETVYPEIQVTLLYAGKRKTFLARYDTDVYDVVDYFLAQEKSHQISRGCEVLASQLTAVAYFREKPLRRSGVPLTCYNMWERCTVSMQLHFLQGGGVFLPTYQIVQECEQEILNPKILQLQSGSLSSESDDVSVLATLRAKLRGKASDFDVDFLINLIEGSLILGYQMVRARNVADRMAAVLAFVKGQTSGPLLSSARMKLLRKKYDEVFGVVDLQGAEEVFANLRSALDSYEDLSESKLMQKMQKFVMYALSLSLFERVGITFDSLNYSKLEKEAMKRKYPAGPGMVHCFLDCMLFIAERGHQCMKSGSLDPIFHSGSSYEAWFDGVTKLKRQAKFLSNPSALNFTIPEFIANLDEAIDKGKAIGRHTRVMDALSKRLYCQAQADLEMLKCEHLTKRAAGMDRKAPFGLLVYGGSGIAKSAFTKMLFYHFGKITGNNTGSEFRYVRNANDEFWSGFDSSKWCIQLDDIAYLDPSAAPGGDKSILEMLQVVNSVPFVPAQADLADKGKTPLRAELVIATSNTKDINAFHYFACPLAIQRRLPYVITLEVKQEYARDSVFLDAGKAPSLAAGEYPNFWNITVSKVVPAESMGKKQLAGFEQIHKFTDIYEFIAWYSRAALQFRGEQDKVDSSDKAMSQTRVCSVCYLPENHGSCEKCSYIMQLQSMDVVLIPFTWAFMLFRHIVYTYLNFCYGFACFLGVINLLCRFKCIERIVMTWVNNASADVTRLLVTRAGRSVQKTFGRIVLFVIISSWIGTFVVYGKFFVRMFGTKKKTTPLQGNVESASAGGTSVGRAPTNKGESENVWFNDRFICTDFDMPTKGRSWFGEEQLTIFTRVENNSVKFQSKFDDEDGVRKVRINGALCLGGHLYVTNNHGLPEKGKIDLTVTGTTQCEGVNNTYTVAVYQKDVFRMPAKDLAFIEISGIPARKRITDLLVSPDLRGTCDGFYVNPRVSGSHEMITMRNVQKNRMMIERIGEAIVWAGRPQRPTEVGDCGAAMYLRNGMGYFLAGIHVGGVDDIGASIPLDPSDVDHAVEHFRSSLISPGLPSLGLQNKDREVGELHSKSPFRFIQQGVANVYGSFSDFRVGGRSKVTKAITHDAAIARGYVCKTGAPVMRGWQPWYNAAKEMVEPVTQMKQHLVKQVAKEFLAEIVARIDKVQLRDEVFVYDDLTAINGANGVRYVDKMNRSTSMGCPWKKSKKHFMHQVPATEGCADPYMFDDETMMRVDNIMETYKRGERCMPVFSGSLKDEALKMAKILAAKTRLFCASPADWNVVVRKYYLSLIRFMQMNRFIFEAGPGTVAQSLEWQDIRDYLIHFGENKMVAGDYAAFDKKMPATIILEAFSILIELARMSGNYSDVDILIMQGIAEDTAFPLVDMNGDLVEFFGSNPSGHPLTVIINSLVNSLYMRYVYAELNPSGNSAADFKRNVRLMTYGDDNVMGVRGDKPWFNHTSIADCLKRVGITYTMADKEAVSVPYIHIDEVSFLKRTWRWDEDLQSFVCPLDEASIAKMLTMCVPSKTDSMGKQACDVLSTVCREYFWYGREVFELKRKMCCEMAEECDLLVYVHRSTFPTWENLKEAFFSASKERQAINC